MGQPGSRQPSAADGRHALGIAGRVGLAGRTGFYVILVVLTARIAAFGGAGARQDNAHGALTLLSRSWLGKAAIAAVAVGFVLLGAGRFVGGLRDRSAGTWRRVATMLQGLFYVALAYVPASFLAGNAQTGSEQQQHRTVGRLLGLPAGRELVIAVGLGFLVVCGLQIRSALNGDFTDGLRYEEAPAAVQQLVRVAGTVGIVARAVVFAPIGIFFIVAAVQFDPNRSRGLDGELLDLSGRAWGVAILVAITAGLAVFALYSALEARYRHVVSAN